MIDGEHQNPSAISGSALSLYLQSLDLRYLFICNLRELTRIQKISSSLKHNISMQTAMQDLETGRLLGSGFSRIPKIFSPDLNRSQTKNKYTEIAGKKCIQRERKTCFYRECIADKKGMYLRLKY